MPLQWGSTSVLIHMQAMQCQVRRLLKSLNNENTMRRQHPFAMPAHLGRRDRARLPVAP